jgi:hypothetical protein
MIIEFNSPHSLNMGEDFEYISTYNKGKKTSVENYRILIKGKKTGKEGLLMLEKRENMFGKDRYHIGFIDEYKTLNENHLKNKNYNYYDIGDDPKTVEDFFNLWKNSDPLIHIGGKTHQFLSKIPNYNYSYKFNKKQF